MEPLLVGREGELAEIRRALDDCRSGRGRLFLFVGEPGIGKTRLADELTRLARDGGFRDAWGRCWESGGAPAYWPWTQALEAFVCNRSASELRQLLGNGGADVAQIVPGLRLILPDLPERTASSTESRFELHAAVLSFVRALGEREPLALVLDDLHAADVSSLLLLKFMARELRGTRLCLVGTYRDVEARLSEDVSRLLAQISRDARVLELHRLDRDQTRELLRGAGVRDDVVSAVLEASQGNPLFIDELCRLLSAREPGSRLEMPDGVREVIRGRLKLIGDTARATLAAAAVLGSEFESSVLAGLVGKESEAVDAVLGEGTKAGVLRARNDGCFTFSHILYRDALYAELERTERAALHRRAADQLREPPRHRLSELAHHCQEAGDAEGAVRAATGAAEWAFERQAYEDAVTLLERAAALNGVSELDARLRFELELALGRSRIGAGRAALGTQNCVAAADIARSLGDPELLARAALGYGFRITPGSIDSALVTLLEQALEALGSANPALRACVMARLAGAMQPTPEVEGPMQLAREAVSLARSVGDARTMATVLYGAGSALAVHASPEERIELGVEHERLASALGDRTQLLRARRRLVFAYLELADLASADRTIEAYETLARQLGQAHELWPGRLMRAMRAAMHGRFVEADELYHEARELALRSDSQDAPVTLAMHRMVRLLMQERHEDLIAYLPEMRASLSTISTGHFQAASNEAVVRARLGQAIELTPVLQWMLYFGNRVSESSLSVTFVEVAVAIADEASLRTHYEHWSGRGDRLLCWGVFSMACEGPIANSLGLAARRLGRPLEALRHFEHATERADALGLRPSAAISRCHWAETLLEHGSRDDVARVRPVLEAARETAAELSMSSLSERIDALFAKLPAEAGAEIAIHTAHSKKTPFELVSEGEVWAVRFGSTLFRLKDSKGVQTLARLVENAGRELHVLELVGTDEGVRDGGDSGELLDAQARDEYRRRLETLDELIEEAEGFGDAARASRAREEREQIATEIARAVGLGGRTRRAGSAAERARTAIQRRLKDAIQRIGEQCPPLRRHLESSLRTGTFCSYRPIDE